MEQRTPQVQPEHITQFFDLGTNSQPIECEFYAMAQRLIGMLPRNPERTVALRKLLEAKDAAVRAAIAK